MFEYLLFALNHQLTIIILIYLLKMLKFLLNISELILEYSYYAKKKNKKTINLIFDSNENNVKNGIDFNLQKNKI